MPAPRLGILRSESLHKREGGGREPATVPSDLGFSCVHELIDSALP